VVWCCSIVPHQTTLDQTLYPQTTWIHTHQGPACVVDAEWMDGQVDDAPTMTGCPGSIAAAVSICGEAKTHDSCSKAPAKCAWCVDIVVKGGSRAVCVCPGSG